jgi:hypothetical protein
MSTTNRSHLLVAVAALGAVGHSLARAIGGGPGGPGLGQVLLCIAVMLFLLFLAASIFRACHLSCDGNPTCEMQCINGYVFNALLIVIIFFACTFG